MKHSKVRRRLGEALESGRVVRVWRDEYDSTSTDGILIALTQDWFVMHVVDDGVHLDGLVMMRTRDVDMVRHGHDEYVQRGLQGLGTPVATFTCSDDVTARDLIMAAAELHPLSAFALGDEGEEQLMIGTLVKAGKKRVRHRFIRPNGTWALEDDRWRYEQISSITVGGRYIDSLARFGLPSPV
ncbi:hypothetical protein [Nocardioides sp. Root190]|uniref:hypothetical protein n=1 Tax=Nocardioides sp. Root190 TaxID=1736488 RepID=UPI0012F95EAE|nr:hypothetical protein [Nocardioides sp. Root190]